MLRKGLVKIMTHTFGTWYEIESAPTDGTEVLTCERGPNYSKSIRTCRYMHDIYDGDRWQDDADTEPEPSHWMPLPPPPAKEG